MTPEDRIAEVFAEQTAWLDASLREHLLGIEHTFFDYVDRLAYEAALFAYRERALAALESQLRAAIGRLN